MKNMIFNNFYKLDLKDAKLDKSGGQKALLVELEMSASGKVTNGRIYPPKGHQAGLDSWTDNYMKPVLTYHDDNKDPIGRVVSVRWVETDEAALSYLKGDYKALAAIKRAFATGTPQDIYQAMKKYGALDKKWPGLGKVIGTVRITDQAAVEKFIDGRYLTCSAGQSTDSYTCMLDGMDWHRGQVCEHSNGGMDEDGNLVIFLCGNMSGSEISMVNIPANDTSVTISMKFEDDARGHVETNTKFSDMLEGAPTITPSLNWEKDMNLKDLQELEITALLNLLKTDANAKEFLDALKGDTHYEQTWLIRIHDALHHEWDFQVKYADPNDARMPMAVYQLHGALHDISMDKDFRDSFLNGPLDEYSSGGEATGEYKVDMPEPKDSQTPTLTDQISTLVAQIQALIEATTAQPTVTIPAEATPVTETTGATDGTQEEKEDKQEEVVVLEVKPEDQSDEDLVQDDTIDWEIFDLALDSEVGDAKLSTEKRKTLKGSTFCGPGRSFPVPDCAHVTAARRLVGRAKLSADQKSRVLACVNRKAKTLGCGDSTDSTGCTCKHDDVLRQDYANALLDNQKLSDRLGHALKLFKVSTEPESKVDDLKLDILNAWLDTLILDEQNTTENVSDVLKPTNNPSVAQTNPIVRDTSKLTGFQKTTVDKYSKILNDKTMGVKHADEYLKSMREYLPTNFDIHQYVG